MSKKKRRLIAIIRARSPEALRKAGMARTEGANPTFAPAVTTRVSPPEGVLEQVGKVPESTEKVRKIKIDWHSERNAIIPNLMVEGEREGFTPALVEVTNQIASGENLSDELSDRVFKSDSAEKYAEAISEGIRRWSTPERE